MSEVITLPARNASPLLVRAATETRIDGAIHPDTRKRLYDFGYTAADIERALNNLRRPA